MRFNEPSVHENCAQISLRGNRALVTSAVARNVIYQGTSLFTAKMILLLPWQHSSSAVVSTIYAWLICYSLFSIQRTHSQKFTMSSEASFYWLWIKRDWNGTWVSVTVIGTLSTARVKQSSGSSLTWSSYTPDFVLSSIVTLGILFIQHT